MITIQEMKAEVDRHLAWMVKPGRPTAQRSLDIHDGEWADATFLVGGDEVSVSAEQEEDGISVAVEVLDPDRRVILRRFLAVGEDLGPDDRRLIEELLDEMGTRVKFPAGENRTRWSDE